jgi:hypothetical protein
MITIHVFTELLAYGWTFFCIRHAWRRGGWPVVVVLIAGGLYGLILEYSSVKANVAYCYDPAMIMIPPWPVAPPPGDPCPIGPAVPLWIAFGWMMTIYVAMQTSSRLDLPFYVRPLVDGLLGMSIDWILDPLAAHALFWQWYQPGPYYGIPLENFFGWFVTIAAFSLALRLAQRKFGGNGRMAVYGSPAIAIVAGIAIVTILVKGFVALGAHVSEELMLGATLGAALLIVLPHRFRVKGALPPDWFIIAESVSYTLYYSALMWITGLYAKDPSLVLVSIGVLVFATAGYSWPYAFGPRPGTRTGA